MNEALNKKGIFLLFQEEPGEENKKQIDSAAEEQERLGFLNIILDFRAIGES